MNIKPTMGGLIVSNDPLARQDQIAQEMVDHSLKMAALMGHPTSPYGSREDWIAPGAPVTLRRDGRRGTAYYVTLSKRMHILGREIAAHRFAANSGRSDSKDMSKGRNHDERDAQDRGVLGEIAGHIALDFPPHVQAMLWPEEFHEQFRGGSDIDAINVEIRTVWQIGYAPAIHAKDLKPGRMLLALAPVNLELTQWKILGQGLCQTLWNLHERPRWWDDEKDGPWDKNADVHAAPLEALDAFDPDALRARADSAA